ncbi:ABC transporter permease [Bifidobacterium longum subsp. longum]|nr:ABC transporter permease [Bifidobacterium longum subsp. longum]MBV4125050.1 carbohydrate ABC transporter permease [Bifidobacterium longum]MBL3905357.1 carbohydrate ABC transporter permease [Bifidobacterium longum subsp. longum]MBL3914803.1 carbohydrate ABC transporter permease [Bifidobacterium longum subsp. longum]MBV4134089.1 carbohydrate ABC transporter permease [Bifidobacterium longum]
MNRIEQRDRVKQSKTRKPINLLRWVILIACVLFAILILSPLFLMVLNAFKTSQDYTQNGPLSLPHELYFGGLVNFWKATDFPIKFWNSLWISVVSALLSVVLSLFNAYALGIGRVRGSSVIIALFMILTMLPGEGFIYPLFYMFNAVGMGNSQWTIVIICGIINMAFGTYLLSSVMSTFPKELLEAAQIDGAGRWRTLRDVVFPIMKSNCAVLFIFFFIWTWNEFYFTLIFLVSGDTQTIPLAIASLQGDRIMDVPTINAGSLISLIPAFVFFLIFQRTLTKGITAGAVK